MTGPQRQQCVAQELPSGTLSDVGRFEYHLQAHIYAGSTGFLITSPSDPLLVTAAMNLLYVAGIGYEPVDGSQGTAWFVPFVKSTKQFRQDAIEAALGAPIGKDDPTGARLRDHAADR